MRRQRSGNIYIAVTFGMVRNVQPCPECRGKGKIIKENVNHVMEPVMYQTARKSRFSVPAGIDDGQIIRIAGKGEPGENGGERGDLLVEVVVSRSPISRDRIQQYIRRFL